MATSLARQLGQVRQNALETVSKNKVKQQQSLSVLFNKKDAVKTDLETIYDIAIDGLEKLVELNQSFLKFKTSLFSETSKQVDRTLQTAEENTILNSAIEEFLALLAPRLQLQCSLQALEWLIRRFRVHELNANALFLTILPYYSHPHFPVILSVVKLSRGFQFLKSCQDQYSMATRHTVIQAFARDLTLWTQFSNHVSKVVMNGASYHALIAFWASISVETIVKSKEGYKYTDANVIEISMPIVSNGLIMLKSPDFQIATYMVLTALVSCCSLSDRAIKASLETIGKYLTSSTFSAGLACAAQLCQVRQGLHALPKTLYSTLRKQGDVVARLIQMSERVRADKLVTGFCLNVIKSDKAEFSTLVKLLEHPTVSGNEVEEVIKKLAELLYSEDSELRERVGKFLTEIAACDRLLDFLIKELKRTAKDIELLEMTYHLRLQPQLKQPQPPSKLKDVVVTNGHHLSAKDLVRSVSADKQITTFLCDDARALLATVIGVFLQIQSNSPALDEFFALDLFQHGNISRVTLLIRVWTGRYPMTARLAALKCYRERFLQSMLLFDTQAIIPHLLIAMSDESNSIRTLALEIVAALESALSSLSKQADVWAMDELYGTTNSVKLVWISSKETKRFLAEVVLPKRSEIEMDGEFAAISLRQILPINVRGKELAYRNSLIDFFSSHAVQSPVINIKKRLLDIFRKADADMFASRGRLVPLLTWWSNEANTEESHDGADECSNLEFEKGIVDLIGINGLKELLHVLHSGHSRLSYVVTCRLIDDWHLFSDIQKVEVSQTYRSMLVPSEISQQKVANEFFDNIQLPSLVLRSLLPQQEPSLVAGTKPKKIVKVGERSLLPTINALEILERNSPESHLDLGADLFAAFNTYLSSFSNPASHGTYCEELFISCLLRMLNSNTSKVRIQASETRIDLLVNLLRSSNSPQLQQKTLLLIAAIAKLFPDQVLHGTMSVFTFMGASVLRQDSHSNARVIEEAIQKIVPQLIKLQPSPRKQILTTGELLRNFTTAIEHIPEHRRQNLLVSLAKVLGVESSLHLVLLLLVEKDFEHQGNEDVSAIILPLGSLLLTSFDGVSTLAVVRNYIDFVREEFPLHDVAVKNDPKENYFGVPLDKSKPFVKHLYSSVATMMQKAFFSVNEEESVPGSILTAVKDLLGSLLQALTGYEDHTAIEESLLDIFNELVLGTTIETFGSIVSELIHYSDVSVSLNLENGLTLAPSKSFRGRKVAIKYGRTAVTCFE